MIIVGAQRETQDITLIFTFAFALIHLVKAFNQTIWLFQDSVAIIIAELCMYKMTGSKSKIVIGRNKGNGR